MKILVTGGFGFIGAHFVNLAKKDHEILVVDNFCQGRNNIIEGVRYAEVDIRDRDALLKVFEDFKPDVVNHFAALANVSGSIRQPEEFYENNIMGTSNVLRSMRIVGCDKMIFSSTAAVYEVTSDPIDESYPVTRVNPYGHSKLVVEQVLQDYFKAYGLSSVSFRPFCATGVDEKLAVGCYHNPETQLIPNIIKTFTGKQEVFNVFGNDHPTPDGTAIRDYIHVNDIAEAHLLALKKLENPVCEVYNLGMNQGYSIMEIIKMSEEIVGKKLNYEIKPRREGDPSKLIGNSNKAMKELGWKPTRTIEDIIKSDYEFFKSF